MSKIKVTRTQKAQINLTVKQLITLNLKKQKNIDDKEKISKLIEKISHRFNDYFIIDDEE